MPNQFYNAPANGQNWQPMPQPQQPINQSPYSWSQYVQWVQHMQQAQQLAAQQAQAMAVRGRIVNSESDISARDVSMDGYTFFPQNDESCIYVKHWNTSGTIDTKKYIPEPAPQQQTLQQDQVNTEFANAIKALMNRLDSIEKQLGQKGE